MDSSSRAEALTAASFLRLGMDVRAHRGYRKMAAADVVGHGCMFAQIGCG